MVARPWRFGRGWWYFRRGSGTPQKSPNTHLAFWSRVVAFLAFVGARFVNNKRDKNWLEWSPLRVVKVCGVWRPFFRRYASGRLLGLVAAAFFTAGCEPPVPPERDLLIATASMGGTYYPVGVTLANTLNRELRDELILASAITSSGAMENLAMMREGEAQLGMMGALQGAMAWRGLDLFQGQPLAELRSVTGLWPNVEQALLLRTYAVTGTIEDLRGLEGRRFSMGPRWSGSEVGARIVMETLGIEPGTDFRPVYLGYGASADALQNRQVEGFFLAGGVPTGALTQVFAALGADAVVPLEFSDDQLQRLRAEYPVWDRFIIPTETYPGQEEPVATIAQLNFLATMAEVDEEVIYQVTRALWENLDDLQQTHAATRAMSLETAMEGLPVPLHPGAVRYYREVGLEIPEALLPP